MGIRFRQLAIRFVARELADGGPGHLAGARDRGDGLGDWTGLKPLIWHWQVLLLRLRLRSVLISGAVFGGTAGLFWPVGLHGVTPRFDRYEVNFDLGKVCINQFPVL